MNKKITLSVVFASTVLCSSSAWSQFVGQGFSKRIYLGIGAGQSLLDPDTSAIAGLDVEDDSDAALNVTLGFDFSRRLTVELQYTDLGTAELTDGDGIEYTAASASGIVYLWNVLGDSAFLDLDGLDQRTGLSLYGRLGIGTIENEAVQTIEFERENDVQLVAGLGVEYALDMGLGVRAEYINYDSDTNYAGLTLLYRFGGGLRASEELPELAEIPIPSPPAPPQPLPVPPQPEQQPAPPAVVTAPPPPPPLPTAPPPLQSTDDLLQNIEDDSLPQFVAADTDSDGVLDTLDECPATPAGNPVDQFGCEVFNRAIDGVSFLSGSDTLTNTSRSVLSNVVSTLLADPNLTISVQAHTDSLGDDEFNFLLSRNRAIAVVRYLISQGVPLTQLEARAFGETQPVADNSTSAGRLLNRRVEFMVVQ